MGRGGEDLTEYGGPMGVGSSLCLCLCLCLKFRCLRGIHAVGFVRIYTFQFFSVLGRKVQGNTSV